MKIKKFPRVLIISGEPFNRSNATGITLSNLFDGWDKDNLAQIYINNSAPCQDICANYFHLKQEYAPFDFYLRTLISYLYKNNSDSSSPAGVVLNKKEKNLKTLIHLNLRAVFDFSFFYIPSSLYNWINEFNPDVIYCMLGSVRMINLANTIAKKTGKPIVPHFMDDWSATLYTQNELMGLARYLFEKKLTKTFSLSKGGLCISDLMAKEYEARYNLPFIGLANCVDESFFCEPIFDARKETYIFMYVGGLHLNRWQSLQQLSKAIEEINSVKKMIALKIYAPIQDIKTYANCFREFSSTQFVGSLKSEEVFSVLKDADILLHIESFDENYVNYTKYSLSTKIPQYMAAGKPILAYGPSSLASIKLIQQTNAGKVVCEEGEEILLKNIKNLILNSEELFFYSKNGFEYAKKKFSKKSNLDIMTKLLNDISYSTKNEKY